MASFSNLLFALLVSLAVLSVLEAVPPPRKLPWKPVRPLNLPTCQACLKRCPRCLLPGNPYQPVVCLAYMPSWYFKVEIVDI